MIQPLRTVHRRAFCTLAFVLPAILVIGLAARHPRWRPEAHPAQLPSSAYLVRESPGLWQKHLIHSQFYSDSNSPRDIHVVLQPAQVLNEPDLLLYWAAVPPSENSLPSQAQLLGVFAAGKAFALPLNGERAGYLVLFSLAHQVLFDTAAVEKLP